MLINTPFPGSGQHETRPSRSKVSAPPLSPRGATDAAVWAALDAGLIKGSVLIGDLQPRQRSLFPGHARAGGLPPAGRRGECALGQWRGSEAPRGPRLSEGRAGQAPDGPEAGPARGRGAGEGGPVTASPRRSALASGSGRWEPQRPGRPWFSPPGPAQQCRV